MQQGFPDLALPVEAGIFGGQRRKRAVKQGNVPPDTFKPTQHRRIARVVVLTEPQQLGLVGVGLEVLQHVKAVQTSLILGWNFVPQALGCFGKGLVGHRLQSVTDALEQP
ncbi:L1 capsid protein (Fragment) [Meiothermus ruber H328]